MTAPNTFPHPAPKVYQQKNPCRNAEILKADSLVVDEVQVARIKKAWDETREYYVRRAKGEAADSDDPERRYAPPIGPACQGHTRLWVWFSKKRENRNALVDTTKRLLIWVPTRATRRLRRVPFRKWICCRSGNPSQISPPKTSTEASFN